MLPLFPDSSIALSPDETFRGEDCAPLCAQVAQRDERFVRYFPKAAEAAITSASTIHVQYRYHTGTLPLSSGPLLLLPTTYDTYPMIPQSVYPGVGEKTGKLVVVKQGF